ncbi:MAG TPA: CpsD/CapB family tyrosine-protein kinase [Terriglobales bacterium]|nr:CpsD/CapB family tyrosine-protein kinase [Terriglobales bacterium]
MSRVYEALQRSQGDKSSASPLVPHEAEDAGLATAVAVAPAMTAAEQAQSLNVPNDRVLHPTPTPEQRLVALSEPDGKGAEMFRVLATRLAHMQNKRRLQKLLITSSVVDEGKSVVAVNLALTLARRPDTRVLLIEADLRRPTAGTLLSSSKLRGISEWNDGKLALEDSLYQLRDLPLWFMAAGHPMSEPLPLLESDRFAKMLDAVSANFDWVLLDATPMLPMADSTSLARLCDGVLVVVREGVTRKRILNRAVASLEKSKLVGVVFNQASTLNLNYEHYYGGNHAGEKSKRELKKEAKKAQKEADQVKAASA